MFRMIGIEDGTALLQRKARERETKGLSITLD